MELLTWVVQDHNRLVYRLPKPRPDGRSQLYLTPLELLDRQVNAMIDMTFLQPSLAQHCSLYLAPARTLHYAILLRLRTRPPDWNDAEINQDIYDCYFDQTLSG
jgi:hypothetical protein